jgi:hypothetical protein
VAAAFAVSVAVVALVLSYQWSLATGHGASDFTNAWEGARALIAGENPYEVIIPRGDYPYKFHFLYPLTAAILALPFAPFPPAVAGALFFALGAGCLAYAVARTGWHRVPAFLSAPFIVASAAMQWSPLIMAAALVPALGFVFAAKPHIGACAFLWRPTRLAFVGGLAILALSLAIQPTWPLEWLRLIRAEPDHQSPLIYWPTAFLFAALPRWRSPDARLLLILAVLPRYLFFYDELLLFLIPRRWRESLFLAGMSLIGFLGWYVTIHERFGDEMPRLLSQPWVFSCVHIPALALIFWHWREERSSRPTISPPPSDGARDEARTPLGVKASSRMGSCLFRGMEVMARR